MASVTVPPTMSAQMREKYQLTRDTPVQVIAEAKERLLALEDDWGWRRGHLLTVNKP